mmetsp:Transcript_100024/g.173592  ORF Transcript_100024/g.173592 Transcript_100024/m.173592 type:complete len:205 (-) Transcript_100024:154-768(-)
MLSNVYLLIISASSLASGADAASLLRRGKSSPVVKDSETHIPPFRADGTLTFISTDEKGQETKSSINIEVPQTFSKFMEGLMWRKDLSDDQGMIFNWNQDGPRSFWMENTYVALDIIYVNHKKNIVSIKKAEPLSVAGVPSAAPAMYAVEVPLGWTERNGVRVGDHVSWHLTSTNAFFVAQDAPNFGASSEEVQKAEDDGVYNP